MSEDVGAVALRLVPRPGTVRGVVERPGAACAAVDTDDGFRFLVVLLGDGPPWTEPSMLNGTKLSELTSDRASHYVPDLSSQQVAPAGPKRPVTAWTALAGTAPAGFAVATSWTTTDTYRADIGADGLFLLLLRAPWGPRPAVSLSGPAGTFDIGPR